MTSDAEFKSTISLMQAILLAAVTTAKYFLVASNVTSDADFKSAIILMQAVQG